MKTNSKNRFIAMLLIGALAVMAPRWAMAVNTAACTQIANQATVDYTVNSVSQPQQTSNSSTFKVGNKINLTVQTTDLSWVSVAPSQTGATLGFKITNNGNASQIYHLSMGNTATDPHGGTDNYNASGPAIYVQAAVNGAGAYSAGTTTVLVAPGEYVNAQIRSTIPSSPTTGSNDGDISAHYLMATTWNADGVAQTTAADATIWKDAGTSCTNAEGAYVVFADTAAGHDGSTTKDGIHSDDDSYKTCSPNLEISKSSIVYWDPINLFTSPRAIPSAIVTYTITLTNAGAAACADAIATVADSLNTEIAINGTLAFNTQFDNSNDVGGTACGALNGILIKEGATAAVCRTNAADAEAGVDADFSSNVVNAGTGNSMTIPAGTTTTIKFQATIQ